MKRHFLRFQDDRRYEHAGLAMASIVAQGEPSLCRQRQGLSQSSLLHPINKVSAYVAPKGRAGIQVDASTRLPLRRILFPI